NWCRRSWSPIKNRFTKCWRWIQPLGTREKSAPAKSNQPLTSCAGSSRQRKILRKAMISYETFCKIRQLFDQKHFSAAQIAAELALEFAPGECAQADWGSFGSLCVGSTQRRLSFFVMVLCHSRLLYLEFTLGQGMEQFLSCQQNAFAFFGGVPEKVMIDNLKT